VSEPHISDLVGEWRSAMQSVVSAITSAGRSEALKPLLGPLQRQAELLERVLEQQQRIQGQLVDRAFEPVDAIFDILERSGAMMRAQAEALEQAAQAVEQAAGLMRTQAELFEAATKTARAPADIVRGAAGGGRRQKAPRKQR
jgi:hypothetical protein